MRTFSLRQLGYVAFSNFLHQKIIFRSTTQSSLETCSRFHILSTSQLPLVRLIIDRIINERNFLSSRVSCCQRAVFRRVLAFWYIAGNSREQGMLQCKTTLERNITDVSKNLNISNIQASRCTILSAEPNFQLDEITAVSHFHRLVRKRN